MRDDLSGLTALLTVAEKRSFTAAASVLRVTPSAVSQTIRALEERLGVRLLQRTTRSVGVTEAGARFLARLKPAMEGVHEAFDSLGELRDRPAGLLRLNIPRLAYRQILAPKLHAFLGAYPDIRVEIHVNDAFVNIVEQGYDAGIRIGEMVEREMIAMRLSADFRVAVVGAPSYFAARPKPKHPRDLHDHDCIGYRQKTSGGVYRWEFTESGEDFEIALEGRLLLDDGDIMIDAAVAGHGLAYVMESSVEDLIAEKKLVRVLDSFCTPFPGLFLYYPSRTHLAPKLQAFVDFMKIGRPLRKARS